MDELSIWVQDVEEEPGETKAVFRPDADVVLKRVSTEQLRASLKQICAGLAKVLTDVGTVGKYRLKEVTVNVEVTAEGGVNLIGTAKIGGTGAITLTFVE